MRFVASFSTSFSSSHKISSTSKTYHHHPNNHALCDHHNHNAITFHHHQRRRRVHTYIWPFQNYISTKGPENYSEICSNLCIFTLAYIYPVCVEFDFANLGRPSLKRRRWWEKARISLPQFRENSVEWVMREEKATSTTTMPACLLPII